MSTSLPEQFEVDPDAFQRNGVALLKGVLTPDEVETLRAGVERNLADLGPLGMNATKPGEPGAFVEDFRNWHRIPSTSRCSATRRWRRPRAR